MKKFTFIYTGTPECSTKYSTEVVFNAESRAEANAMWFGFKAGLETMDHAVVLNSVDTHLIADIGPETAAALAAMAKHRDKYGDIGVPDIPETFADVDYSIFVEDTLTAFNEFWCDPKDPSQCERLLSVMAVWSARIEALDHKPKNAA